ncbi:hypothetical protein DUI87_05045 [Hirundo rustica rustica]|uniref:ribonuclease H n=1 Tax=Hirundo rustica rustica TaxID=333673 RepID=A0A3M0L304_HIRRU|nr:hypothetical protein DUI87_05045 [Hirundo rustica rustica]
MEALMKVISQIHKRWGIDCKAKDFTLAVTRLLQLSIIDRPVDILHPDIWVLIVRRVLYHQEEEMYRFLEETLQIHKREVMTGITIAMVLGLGTASTATGVSALVTQHQGLSQLQMTIDEDLLRTEKSISSLEESISSLLEVILQNRLLYSLYSWLSFASKQHRPTGLHLDLLEFLDAIRRMGAEIQRLDHGVAVGFGADVCHRVGRNSAMLHEPEACDDREPRGTDSHGLASCHNRNSCQSLEEGCSGQVGGAHRDRFLMRVTVMKGEECPTPPIRWLVDKPVWENQWTLPQDKLVAISDSVQEQLDQGHLESSTSPWNTPVFCIKKKSGKWRPQENWPVLIVDLKDCFLTIPLHPDDRQKFAFSVPAINNAEPAQRYQRRVLPQGCRNSPAICQCALENLSGQITYHLPSHKLLQVAKFTEISLQPKISQEPVHGPTIFTNGSGRTGKAIVTCRDGSEWQVLEGHKDGSAQLVELRAAVMAFQRFSQQPFNLVTDSAYVADIAQQLGHSVLKEVSNAALFHLLKMLWCAVQAQVYPYYILHVRSHTNLPGFVAEGVNPRGLRALEIWQTDVTQVAEFGRLKYVHVTVDTFSSVMWASAHTGEKTRNVIAH